MNKKGTMTAIGLIFFTLFFFAAVSLASNMFVNEDEIQERSFSEVVAELEEDLGTIGSWSVGALLSIGDLFFSILGVSLIDTIGIFPAGVNVFLSLLSIFTIVVVIVWIVSAF